MPRHITYRGRVVYDRPKHLFTEKDLQRIGARLLGQGKSKGPRFYYSFLDYVNMFFLRLILNTVGLEVFTDLIYGHILSMIQEFIPGGPADFIATLQSAWEIEKRPLRFRL
jgi:hypothetical protein